MKSKYYILLSTLLFFSCSKFEFSPNQIRPENDYNNINQKNITNIVSTGSDTLKIAVIGDSQSCLNSTKNTIEKINSIPDISFVIHTGDLVDLGLQREYTWMHELLSELNCPYIVVIGNHDLIANGIEIYKTMYGDLNFGFTINRTKFIYQNTNGSACAFAGDVPDIPWLDNELSDTTDYDQAVIVNHVPPIDADFNSELKDAYVSTLNKFGKTLLEINGHIHEFSFTEPFGDGISYLNSWSTEDEKFTLLKIWYHNFSIETVE